MYRCIDWLDTLSDPTDDGDLMPRELCNRCHGLGCWDCKATGFTGKDDAPSKKEWVETLKAVTSGIWAIGPGVISSGAVITGPVGVPVPQSPTPPHASPAKGPGVSWPDIKCPSCLSDNFWSIHGPTLNRWRCRRCPGNYCNWSPPAPAPVQAGPTYSCPSRCTMGWRPHSSVPGYWTCKICGYNVPHPTP